MTTQTLASEAMHGIVARLESAVKKEKNMANDNETVEQACESICELVIAIHDKEHNEKTRRLRNEEV